MSRVESKFNTIQDDALLKNPELEIREDDLWCDDVLGRKQCLKDLQTFSETRENLLLLV